MSFLAETKQNKPNFTAFGSHKAHHGRKQVHCGCPIRAEGRGPRARGQMSLAGRRTRSMEVSPVRAMVTPRKRRAALLSVSWHRDLDTDFATYTHVLPCLEPSSALHDHL